MLHSIVLKEIHFGKERAVVTLETPCNLSQTQRVALARMLKEKYPKIEDHVCRNSHGQTLGDCIETTSVAHIFEHVILEELRKSSEGEENIKRVFVGKTANTNSNLAKIELKYYDDVQALIAINNGLRVLNEILLACECQRFKGFGANTKRHS